MQANNKFTQARNAFLEWVETIPDGNTWAFFALNNTGISLPFTKNGKEKAKNALYRLIQGINTNCTNFSPSSE